MVDSEGSGSRGDKRDGGAFSLPDNFQSEVEYYASLPTVREMGGTSQQERFHYLKMALLGHPDFVSMLDQHYNGWSRDHFQQLLDRFNVSITPEDKEEVARDIENAEKERLRQESEICADLKYELESYQMRKDFAGMRVFVADLSDEQFALLFDSLDLSEDS